MSTEREAAARCVALKKQYPRIDNPVEAINFALDDAGPFEALEFLECWRCGAWDEIEGSYPAFLKRVAK